MTTTESIQIGSLLLTSISVAVAIKLYLRSRHLEYKNHLYKTKLEAFSSIVYEIENLLNSYNHTLVQLKAFEANPEQTEARPEFDAAMEENIYEFSNRIMKYSVAFPESIAIALYDLSHGQYSAPIEKNISIKQGIELMETMIQQQIDKTNNVYNMIREDLQLSKLNDKLFKG